MTVAPSAVLDVLAEKGPSEVRVIASSLEGSAGSLGVESALIELANDGLAAPAAHGTWQLTISGERRVYSEGPRLLDVLVDKGPSTVREIADVLGHHVASLTVESALIGLANAGFVEPAQKGTWKLTSNGERQVYGEGPRVLAVLAEKEQTSVADIAASLGHHVSLLDVERALIRLTNQGRAQPTLGGQWQATDAGRAQLQQ